MTTFIGWTYRNLVKPIFFKLDPEDVHDRALALGKKLGRHGWSRDMTSAFFKYENPILNQEIHGINFANPVGLSAGFDKNAELTQILPSVGFGFAEVGSITGEPCEGNPRPRLWRLPKSKGLVVYYGLKNDGCETISGRLREQKFDIPIGISIAKTNSPDTVDVDKGIADYSKAFRVMQGIGDFYVINISCPNTHGGEPFSSPERLEKLLAALDQIPTDKPVFVKLAVDVSTEELDALVEVTDRHRVHGFILTNLTKKKDRPEINQEEIKGIEKGGISGKVMFEASNQVISHLYQTVGDRYTIIGVGGIFSAEDAYEKIKLGASLVQLITGMIFNGPQLIGEINRDLAKLLKRDGFESIKDAIGTAHR